MGQLPPVETITYKGQTLALILRATFREPGVHFVTQDDSAQQVGYMRHPKGKVIEPHIHNEVERRITLTQEVLLIRRGRLRVDFYDRERAYLESRILEENDVILLSAGGHGFEALDDLEMIEVKQGPYAGGRDKIRFQAAPEKIILSKED
jgi:mannose-6-phosphate isomerase-like protein (cupin superfamily)